MVQGRPFEEGIPAAYKYQQVKYYPFCAGPGSPMLLTADPWSFLFAWITQNSPKRGPKKANYERALYYAQQAEGFYDAAKVTPLPTKGTIIYYGMLNLAKAMLSVRGIELESTYEHHGLNLPLNAEMSLNVGAPSANHLNIFHEFAKQLGTEVKQAKTVTLSTICSHIPEIHEITFSLGQLEWPKRKFLPVEISLFVNQSKEKLFSEISFEKKNEIRLDTSKFYKGNRKNYFKKRHSDSDKVIYRSSTSKRVNDSNWPAIYRNVCREYSEFDLVTLLGIGGYKYYCDLKPGDYHHLCYSLMLMFYLGTVVRYRPSETSALLNGTMRPLMTEAVAISPNQFLYQIVSHITEHVCVVPHAKI